MQLLESLITEFDLSEPSFISLDYTKFNFEMSKDKIYWIHCNSKTDNYKKIVEKLHLSQDIIDLIHQKDSMPTLLETFDSLTLRIQCLTSNKLHNSRPLKFSNLIIHITEQYCLTITNEPIIALHTFNDNYHKNLKYAKTTGFMLFLLLDAIINEYSTILFDFELIYDHIDFKEHATETSYYANVMFKKKQLMKVSRNAIALRRILMRISGRKISVISEYCRLSLIDLLDHNQLIIGEASAVRDMLNGILGQIDNALMHNLNESMKILTAFSAIFLPLTLITGVYGMNFHWIPELTWKYGYFFTLFLMVFVAFILVFIFKKKKMF